MPRPRAIGIRGFLRSPKLTLDQKQLASLEELAAKGMTLDIINRGALNPKDKVEALATAVPRLRIIIDHLAGAKGATQDPAWVDAMQRLGKHPNIYIKFSSFFDIPRPASGGALRPRPVSPRACSTIVCLRSCKRSCGLPGTAGPDPASSGFERPAAAREVCHERRSRY
ncbi:amidohydrolase family protein [Sorangium sp. So ce1153]|uniref:amidohydrolase family protein n=1 Tax=Sorangium sp. So ce1153 TaxID=3133333 RepID=UPI003F6054E4